MMAASVLMVRVMLNTRTEDLDIVCTRCSSVTGKPVASFPPVRVTYAHRFARAHATAHLLTHRVRGK